MHDLKVQTFGSGIKAHPVIPSLIRELTSNFEPEISAHHPAQTWEISCARLHIVGLLLECQIDE